MKTQSLEVKTRSEVLPVEGSSHHLRILVSRMQFSPSNKAGPVGQSFWPVERWWWVVGGAFLWTGLQLALAGPHATVT